MESSEHPRGSGVKTILIGCGVLAVLALALLGAGIAWIASVPEGGVKMANEMDAYALRYLAEHKVLNRTETLLAYYDETISMKGTEAAILTTENVLYHKNGRTTAIPLREIAEVRHHVVTLTGDVIEVVGRRGDRMKIEIAPLNDGEAFLNALNDARRRASADAPAEGAEGPPVDRPTPPPRR